MTVDTEIVILQNSVSANSKAKASVFHTLDQFVSRREGFLEIWHEQNVWKEKSGEVINIFRSQSEKNLLSKLIINSRRLDQYFNINVGIKPYQTGKGIPKQSKQDVKNRPFDSDFQETEFHLRYLRGRDIGRYIIAPLQTRYLKYGEWLAESRPAAKFDAPEKIFMRQTGDSLTGCLDDSQYLSLNNMHVLVPNDDVLEIRFFLGIVNSRLMNWFHQSSNPEVGEALAEIKREHIANLPIRTIDFNNPSDKVAHDTLVGLVEKMIAAKKSLASARTDADRQFYERFSENLDRQIDDLVYQLYDITPEERKIIEGN